MATHSPREQARRRPKTLTVRELMRPAVVTVERDAHLSAAAYLMRKAGDTALVVVDDEDRLLGIITDTDVAMAVAEGKNPEDVRIGDLLGARPLTISPHTTAAGAAVEMISAHVRHLPVVAGGRVVGLIDISDACRGLVEEQQDLS